MLRFFVILRSAATKDPLLRKRGGHGGKILRCAQDDRDESAQDDRDESVLEDRGRNAEKAWMEILRRAELRGPENRRRETGTDPRPLLAPRRAKETIPAGKMPFLLNEYGILYCLKGAFVIH